MCTFLLLQKGPGNLLPRLRGFFFHILFMLSCWFLVGGRWGFFEQLLTCFEKKARS